VLTNKNEIFQINLKFLEILEIPTREILNFAYFKLELIIENNLKNLDFITYKLHFIIFNKKFNNLNFIIRLNSSIILK